MRHVSAAADRKDHLRAILLYHAWYVYSSTWYMYENGTAVSYVYSSTSYMYENGTARRAR